MQKKDENKIIINCWWDICLDNRLKNKYYEDNLTFFDKLCEYISDFLWIDFFIPYSSYHKVKGIRNNWNYVFLEWDPKMVFDKLKEYLDPADINCFNMEFPLSNEFCHFGAIWCPTSYAEILKKWKINYVSIANNHVFDLWAKWFRDTLDCLQKNGIHYFGWWVNDVESHKPCIYEKEWTRIWFLWYFQNTRTNINYVCSAENKPWINPICEEEIFEDILNSKNKYGCDLVFVSLHGDVENHSRISKKFKKLCKKIIDVWADWVFWHHSHVPKKFEIYKWKPIFYSFGNFVFWQFNKKYWKDNFFSRIEIDGGVIKAITILSIQWNDEFLFKPKVVNFQTIRL